jgi:hypothetical protein
MFEDRDFDADFAPMPLADAFVEDLELRTLFSVMSCDDAWLAKTVPKALTQPLEEVAVILYRQHALRDCIAQPKVARELYDLSAKVLEDARRSFFRSIRSPSSILYWSVTLLEMLSKALRRLRAIADGHIGAFGSQAFRTLFEAIRAELSDDYLAVIDRQLRDLAFRDGVLLSARLGEGNKGTDYVLQDPPRDARGWFARFFDLGAYGPYTLRIADRDEAGARALSDLRDRGLNSVANAVAQSCDHLLSFFELLRTEVGFYVACLNLHARLSELNLPVCFPEPREWHSLDWRGEAVYDACLALRTSDIVGNDLDADGRALVIVTGANQGGKSTFLRAVGLTYVMMQCGMFVPARSLRASMCRGLFTHHRREEDAEMKSGKLDEELRRMSDIVDRLQAGACVLFNESFASTNEREGSEIARQVVSALVERGVRVFFVTHQFEFARSFRKGAASRTLFLRAQRLDDGTRTFKMLEGLPLQTSHGADLYREIFREDTDAPEGDQ